MIRPSHATISNSERKAVRVAIEPELLDIGTRLVADDARVVEAALLDAADMLDLWSQSKPPRGIASVGSSVRPDLGRLSVR